MTRFKCGIIVLLCSTVLRGVVGSEAVESDVIYSGVDSVTIEVCDEDNLCSIRTISPVFEQVDGVSGIYSSRESSNEVGITSDATSNTPNSISNTELPNTEIVTSVSHTNDSNYVLEPPLGSETFELKDNASSKHSNETSDDYYFMSFEEWKKQKQLESQSTQNRKLQNDSSMRNESVVQSTRNKAVTEINTKTLDKQEQGTTYQNKFNYASLTCAATIMKTNKDSKGAKSILDENKDTYLLNECSNPNKFVVIELCQDIQVDTVVVGNFEFFSSMFKELRISVSDRFPEGEWLTLGHFTAANIRDVQTFKIANPLIWARYLKLEILSHYGNEFYCPISLVRVHGKTMMEEYKEEASPKNEVGINEDEVLPISDYTVSDDSINEECKILVPYLGLNEFLKEKSAMSNDYCNAIDSEAESQQTTTKTAQESIYRNIMKRLSLLESNTNVSFLYIEEQSKLLSSAFTNLEKAQSRRYESYLSAFNTTITKQLVDFRNSFQNLQNGYSNSFKAQEKLYSNLLRDSRVKLESMTRELKFQKVISGFNMILMFCLLLYLVITREAYIDWNQTEEYLSTERKKRKAYSVGAFSKKSTKRSGIKPNKRRYNSWK